VLVGTSGLEAMVTTVHVGSAATDIEAVVPTGAAKGRSVVRVVNYQGVETKCTTSQSPKHPAPTGVSEPPE
jgi:hypothetical protein